MEKKNNKKRNLFDLKNISDEDKKKYGAIAVIAIIFCGFMTYGILGYTKDDDQNKVEDFSNPEAELSKYNNKLEAINPKRDGNQANNLEHTFGLSGENQEMTNENEVSFEQLDRQLANIGKQNNRNIPVEPTNNHNVYGDYSMWQNQEPNNTSIEYASKPIKKESKQNNSGYSMPKENRKENTVKSNIEVYKSQETSPPPVVASSATNGKSKLEERRILLQTGKRDQSNTQSIKAAVDGNQSVRNGQTIRLKLMQDAFINNKFVKNLATIFATVSFGDNRLMMNIRSINVNGEIIACNLTVYATDGQPGLPVDLSSISSANDAINQEVQRGIASSRVGQVISSLFRGSNRNTLKIKVLNNHQIILVQNS